jgi:hypothetical protein
MSEDMWKVKVGNLWLQVLETRNWKDFSNKSGIVILLDRNGAKFKIKAEDAAQSLIHPLVVQKVNSYNLRYFAFIQCMKHELDTKFNHVICDAINVG